MARIIRMKIEGRPVKLKDCKGLSSIRGLMFDNIKEYDGALIYGNSVWMPFIRHRLILFFLDKNMKVLEKKSAEPMTLNPKTWRTYGNKRAKYCAEILQHIPAL